MKLLGVAAALSLGGLLGHALLACSGASSAVAGGDDAATLPADDAGFDASPWTSTMLDGGTKPDAVSDASTVPPGDPTCVQNGACSGTSQCETNDGTTYHYCMCSAGKLACGDLTAAPPTTCVPGGACADGATCAVDDGSRASRCSCAGGAWACDSLTVPSSSCSAMNPEACAFTRPDSGADSWLDCFTRPASGTPYGFVCSVSGLSIGKSGVSLPEACPAAALVEKAACTVLGGPACQCQTSGGTPCVCRCDIGAPGASPQWICL